MTEQSPFTVAWHPTPLPLRTTPTPAANSAASLAAATHLRAAQHVLLVRADGYGVVAAPLTLSVEPQGEEIETKTAATMAEAESRLHTAPVLAGAAAAMAAGAGSTADAGMGGGMEEWTDAVDEEAMAFFDDEEE